jgi:AhpD family alkylhydroperoxidase
MRLAILDNGHRFQTKVLFAIIRAVSRLPVPDAIKLNRYRPDFYGLPIGVVTQKAMRGPSAWSVGDRELMGACVSQINACNVCTKTHAGVAALAYRDEAKVSAVLADLETAPIDEPLRATIRMLRKLTREHAVDADDLRAVLAAGVSREQIEDALAVGFVFNTVDRMSRTFGWVVSGPRAFEAGSRFLFARGYLSPWLAR